jgi:hypothetical protein
MSVTLAMTCDHDAGDVLSLIFANTALSHVLRYVPSRECGNLSTPPDG